MPQAHTRTGNFPIGFRLGGSSWESHLHEAIHWAATNSFASIDLPAAQVEAVSRLADHGLQPGSVDLMSWPGWGGLISPDKNKRAEAVATAKSNIEKAFAAGATIFFALMLPENPDLPRRENFGYLVESYGVLVPLLESGGGKIVVEGWPGPGALCCTPEGYRALFREIPSPAMGVNFDPSHLLRMGIDPIRFLREFVGRVYHVHGKDTEVNAEKLYEFGHEQPATFAEPAGFGGFSWRYTIPGHGQSDWPTLLQLLSDNGYRGLVSIELEDADFNGTEAGDKKGLLEAQRYLTTF